MISSPSENFSAPARSPLKEYRRCCRPMYRTRSRMEKNQSRWSIELRSSGGYVAAL